MSSLVYFEALLLLLLLLLLLFYNQDRRTKLLLGNFTEKAVVSRSAKDQLGKLYLWCSLL